MKNLEDCGQLEYAKYPEHHAGQIEFLVAQAKEAWNTQINWGPASKWAPT